MSQQQHPESQGGTRTHLGVPPLPVQDGSLQEDDLLGGHASVAAAEEREAKQESKD